MREPGKQEAWLDRATLDDARTEAARLMLEAEMYLDARRFEDAVAVLNRLQQIAGRHIAALRLELRAQQGCGNWNEVLRIARQLEKRDALAAEVAREIKLKAHRENIAQRRGDAAQLRAYFARVPDNETGPRLAQAVAGALNALGHLRTPGESSRTSLNANGTVPCWRFTVMPMAMRRHVLAGPKPGCRNIRAKPLCSWFWGGCACNSSCGARPKATLTPHFPLRPCVRRIWRWRHWRMNSTAPTMPIVTIVLQRSFPRSRAAR
ncbi:MAG: hypothetical protein IPL58_07515 [Betaproteobacteria bacterium]|uniref:Uncharacterized protein n=1 Tax=Candidatus Proximibacter danicus TaxID=2954365 RepID=A0A9D7K245_9PROT|nr:hypothetical protein [Candidatus Proximibacter danicus]